jgi:hypothetical protein
MKKCHKCEEFFPSEQLQFSKSDYTMFGTQNYYCPKCYVINQFRKARIDSVVCPLCFGQMFVNEKDFLECEKCGAVNK